jgi:hypothetical protein
MTGNNSVNQKKRGSGPTHWIKVQFEDGSFHTVAGVWKDTKTGEERYRGKQLASLSPELKKIIGLLTGTRYWLFKTKASTGSGPPFWLKVQLEDGSFHALAGLWKDTKNGEERYRGKQLASLNPELEKMIGLPTGTKYWLFKTKANTGA